jgi:outer membrane lipoprotein carrier protein
VNPLPARIVYLSELPMIDLLGIVTRTWLGLITPAGPHLTTAPLVAAPVATAAAATAGASEAVDKVQQFYASLKQVTALFRQEVTNQTFGSTKSSDGKVWISKPGKMRWDYYEKKPNKEVWTKKSFISNGTTLYLVEHDNKQVVKKNLQQDLLSVAVTFLYGKGDLKAEFNAALDTASSYGQKGDIVLKLTPKKPSAQYKNLFLVVDKAQFRVKESVIIDSSNNVNHFQFFAPDFEKSIKDSWFEFDERSVKNYRMVDGDAPQNDKAEKPAAGSALAPAPAPIAPKK